jgi:hypothetical protein
MTDRPDFETTLERRMAAYATTAVRPFSASGIARSTIAAAPSRRARTFARRGPQRPVFVLGLGVALLLAAFVGSTLVGAWKPAIHGVFAPGPGLDGTGRILNAVALPDGRVVVAAEGVYGTIPGTTTLDCTAPCRPHLKILDAETGTFRDARALPPRPALESMALLRDGRVLVVNGDPQTGPSAAIYDPVADRFDPVGDPIERWARPLLVTLADGRVLMVAGVPQPEPIPTPPADADPDEPGVQVGLVASAELFDPASGAFQSTGSMGYARTLGASATLLRDGRVLVVGGGPEVGTSAELYDPESGTFTPTGDTTIARGGLHSATLLPDGRVLIVGGLVPFDGQPRRVPVATGTAEIYDPATGTFTAAGSMAAPRFGHGAALLSDGTVLVAGGSHALTDGEAPVIVTDAEIYDPATGAFRATGSLAHPRLWPSVVTVDDRALVLGTFDPDGDDPFAAGTTEWFE